MTPASSTPAPLWKPSRQLISQSILSQYIEWLFVKKGLYFRNYDDLWDWSVTDLEHFWESIHQFFEVQFTTPYRHILQKSDDGSLFDASWFSGATLNYAEQIFRRQTANRPALLIASEQQTLRELSWAELTEQVAAVSALLRARGVGIGDRVVAVLANSAEAIIAFLATSAVGAVWSVCSPDFGVSSLIDRFQALEPKVLIVLDGYTYNGRAIDRTDAMHELRLALPTLTTTIWLPGLNRTDSGPAVRQSSRFSAGRTTVPRATANAAADILAWDEVLETDAPDGLTFESVPFSHPIWVVYSSGTSGKPRAITHSVGGCLLEHIKLQALHRDVQPGERYFWYSTTGSMMWTIALGALLVGATLVVYEGAPAYPALSRLWELIDSARVNHFGSETTYLLTCMRSGIQPKEDQRLTALRTISVTGAPLSSAGFQWVYEAVKADVWLAPFSGGTDVGSGLVGGNPLVPLYAGEMQCRLLGCKVDAVDTCGQPVRGQAGELVIQQPMPSMPIPGWPAADSADQPGHYFRRGTDTWWHGDWIEITDRNSVIMHGRADATLNRAGIRVGTAEIYSIVEQIPAVADSLVVGVERPGRPYFMPLFVVLRHGLVLDDDLKDTIRQALQSQYSDRLVPDELIQVAELPYTLSGRKLEVPVRKLLLGTDASLVANRDTLRNPLVLDAFAQLAGEIMAGW